MKSINCYYNISNSKQTYNPDDYIEGIFFIKNIDNKDKTIRGAELQVLERFGNTSIDDAKSEIVGSKSKIIQKYNITREYKIRAGDTIEYPFKFRLERWTPKKNYYLELVFKARVGLKLTSGNDEKSAIFYIPAKYSYHEISKKKSKIPNKSERFTTCPECGCRIDEYTRYCEFCGKETSR